MAARELGTLSLTDAQKLAMLIHARAGSCDLGLPYERGAGNAGPACLGSCGARYFMRLPRI